VCGCKSLEKEEMRGGAAKGGENGGGGCTRGGVRGKGAARVREG
jgi:hypothetical protein